MYRIALLFRYVRIPMAIAGAAIEVYAVHDRPAHALEWQIFGLVLAVIAVASILAEATRGRP
jgi:hypothetical protein